MSRGVNVETYPGFIDIHDHFRWPGLNKSENFRTGTRAAVIGAVIMTNDMPNTPGRQTYTTERVDEKHEGIMDQAYHPVGVYAGWDIEGDNRAEIEPMSKKTMGSKAYLGRTTGYEYAAQLGINDYEPWVAETHRVTDKPILIHRGDADLEEIIYVVAEKYTHRLHLCHVNDPEEVKQVMRARKKGLNVSCGVCTHHIVKTSHDRLSCGSHLMMMPELASQIDAEKLLHHLAKGNIQMVETDHAPHPKDKKLQVELENPQGIEGNEKMPVCYGVPGVQETAGIFNNLVRTGKLTKERLIDAYSTQPADLLGVKISPSTFVKMSTELYQIDQDYEIVSGTGNSIYLGCWAVGKVIEMQISGKTVIADGKVVGSVPRVIKNRGAVI